MLGGVSRAKNYAEQASEKVGNGDGDKGSKRERERGL